MAHAEARHPLFIPVVLVGGLIFGFGLALSGMTKPEVVLNFLQFEDFGLLFVMGGGALVTGLTMALATKFLTDAPLTGKPYGRRLKSFDRNVLVGGVIFGAGWGISGICPGAAYASLGIGNVPVLWALGGMFLGAYAQGYWRSKRADDATSVATAD
ncbi:YeeE/YedE family protein [Haloarculaceae archaeon H-GB1-1]|nr:YeeE/YedE family protein [Haloarculaceae archaeon H-GB1-1]